MVLRGFLKFLVGFLIALGILGILLGAVGFFAVRNIDPNMFRAEFEKHLTEHTGFRVELGDIKFQWRFHPQLQVNGLKFYHPKTLEKILQSDQVRIDADLTSIWQKRLAMSEIVIQSPEIFLKRDRGGGWNWQTGQEPVAAPSVTVSPQTGVAPTVPVEKVAAGVSLATLGQVTQGWEFGVGKILVQDATVHFMDETAEPAFKLELQKLDIDARQKNTHSPFHFTAGGTLFNSAKRNLEAEGDLDLIEPSLDLVLRYGPEKVVFRGLLKLIHTMPHFEGTLEAQDLDIEPLIPAPYKQGDYLTGRLSARAQLAFDGANPEVIQRSLSGQGTIDIRDGALRNRNLIREVFDRLSPVLAITNALGGELPPEVNEMLKGRDTPFDSLQIAYAVQAGLVTVSQFRLAHPNYRLSGQGTYGILDQRVGGLMQLLLSQSISGYLVKKIREMEMISDANGQIMIPFRYGGVFPETSVQPDLANIAARLLQGGTGQLLSRGLEQISKKLGGKKAVQNQPEAPDEPASGENPLIQQGLALLAKYQGGEKK